MASFILHDRVKSSAIREDLRVQLLLLYAERSQQGWFRHLVGMPPRVPSFGDGAGTADRGGDLGVDPRHSGGTISPNLHLGVPQEELEVAAGEKDIRAALLSLLPR